MAIGTMFWIGAGVIWTAIVIAATLMWARKHPQTAAKLEQEGAAIAGGLMGPQQKS